MDFGPTVRAPRTLVFSWNQIETPKLRIGHDLFPQRSTPSRDDLDHCLHPPRFNRKSSLLQCLFGETGLSVVFKQRAVHYVNIDIILFRVPKRTRQSADDFKTELLPQTNRGFVSRYNEIELHRAKTEAACFAQTMFAHRATDPVTTRLRSDHVCRIRNVRAATRLVR